MEGPRWAASGIRLALPLDVLERSLNKKMSLQLKDGRLIEGKLVGFDQYMNLVLEESEETRVERKEGGEAPGTPIGRRLGTVILRGNNVVTISPS